MQERRRALPRIAKRQLPTFGIVQTIVFFLVVMAAAPQKHICLGFVPKACLVSQKQSSRTPEWSLSTAVSESGEDKGIDTRDLLDQAQKLRQEASVLEAQLRTTRTANTTPQQVVVKPATYLDIEDSTWTISYRSTDRPENNDPKRKSLLLYDVSSLASSPCAF
jgi:hypothetical protein